MARYKIELAYDGTDFSGFQRQQGAATVQEAVEVALRQIGWSGAGILAAGRTDAGVHAAGQVIAFDLSWGHTEADLQAALNANLPPAVSARAVHRADDQFHPRYDAAARQYVYTVVCQPIRNPLLERFAWRQWPALDLEKLQAAAEPLLGIHDFRGFGRALKLGGSTTREVLQTVWARAGETFRFSIRANAFLYHMVRRIVYALVLVSKEAGGPERIRGILERPDEHPIQGLAPAQGLVLDRVFYPETVGGSEAG
jgi:tRNA pseudouridine38-40 synthase